MSAILFPPAAAGSTVIDGVTVSGTPSANQILTATSGTAATWKAPAVPTTQETLGVPLGTGEANMSRLAATGTWALINESVTITYWTAATTQTAGHIITATGTPGIQTADCTLAQIAVFACTPSTGALTSQLAITANLHASLWATAFTQYTSAFTSTWSQVAGTTYAVAVLAVCTGTMPDLAGIQPTPLNNLTAPYICSQYISQTTMPTSVASGSLSAGATGAEVLYFTMTP